MSVYGLMPCTVTPYTCRLGQCATTIANLSRIRRSLTVIVRKFDEPCVGPSNDLGRVIALAIRTYLFIPFE